MEVQVKKVIKTANIAIDINYDDVHSEKYHNYALCEVANHIDTLRFHAEVYI